MIEATQRGFRICGLWQCVLISVFALLLNGCDKREESAEVAESRPAAEKKSKESSVAAVTPIGSDAITECRFTESEITIDGLADEPAWKNAQTIDNFYLPWLKDKARPSRTKTSAKLLWDRENLYFFADMEDTDLYAAVTEHDGMTWDDDVFELFFKPAADKPGYYEFEINAANTTLDMFIPQRKAGGYPRFKSDRPFGMKTAVKLRGTLNKWQDKDEGWSVEGKIPWRDFLATGGRPAENEIWSFTLCRGDTSVDFEGVELSSTAPLKSLNYADFHHWEDYSPIKFVGPPQKSAVKPFGIEKRIPWVNLRLTGTPDPPPPFVVQRVWPNLSVPYPIHVFHEPGTSNEFLVHQLAPWVGAGQILRIKDDPQVSEYEVLISQDRTFYGMVFHPDFEKNGYVYIGSNGPLKSDKKTTRISRFTVDRNPPHKIDPQSELVIIEWESDGHNGGDVTFGKDGMMYITSGDGTSDSDQWLSGQDLTRLNAKVLRIDVLHPDPGKTYSVPKDNPFIGMDNVKPETWAYGLRNPWRISCDRETGDIWVGNNGQDLWEQIYLIKKGENYGWSVMEGSHPFYPDRKKGPHPFTNPILEHPHSEARSLTGGQVYYGSKFPELRGMYIYGDWSTGKIWAAKLEGGKIVKHQEIASTIIRVTGIGFDSKGEIVIADHSSGYYTLEHSPPAQNNLPFPTQLSQTGLFSNIKEHKIHPGLISYSINAPAWADGAYAERYLALPPDAQLGYFRDKALEFPDGAVLMQSFALEKEKGVPQSRRWIETRLLVKQLGQWTGYSYLWNDEQSDATLVEKEGNDLSFSIRDSSAKNGVRKQPWHFPSRMECMICHSRASNFVLGMSELQMNRDHDYNGVVDNQLRTLEHLGLFKVKFDECDRHAIWHENRAAGKTPEECGKIASSLVATRNQRPAPFSGLLPFTPDKLRHLVNPYDTTQDLTQRVRSYLHANCSHCHVVAGGGNAAMELQYMQPQDAMNVIDVKPLHFDFGKTNPKIIAPGDLDRSIMYQRVSTRQPGQMPPIGSYAVDEEAVKMLKDWIMKLPPSGK